MFIDLFLFFLLGTTFPGKRLSPKITSSPHMNHKLHLNGILKENSPSLFSKCMKKLLKN